MFKSKTFSLGFVLILALALALFVGCGDDDDDKPSGSLNVFGMAMHVHYEDNTVVLDGVIGTVSVFNGDAPVTDATVKINNYNLNYNAADSLYEHFNVYNPLNTLIPAIPGSNLSLSVSSTYGNVTRSATIPTQIMISQPVEDSTVPANQAVTVTWNNVSDADGHMLTVYDYDTDELMYWDNLGANVTSHTIPGSFFTPGTEIEIVVDAYNGEGDIPNPEDDTYDYDGFYAVSTDVTVVNVQ